MPRLPANGTIVEANGDNAEGSAQQVNAQETPHVQQDQSMNGLNNEFNITNFMFDASTDWLGS
jgi:hypothetical protein